MVSGPIVSAGRGGWKLTALIWRKWYIVVTLIILLPSIVSSVYEGVEQKNPMIPIGALGLQLVSADESIYQDKEDFDEIIPEIAKNGELINKIEYWLHFLWNLLREYFVRLWMILFNFFVFYWFFQGLNSSKKTRNKVLAFLTMVFLQVFISLILLVINQNLGIPDVNLYSKMWFVIKSVTPFKGIYSLFKFILMFMIGL